MTFSRQYFKQQRRILGRNVNDIRTLKGISLDVLHEKSGISLLQLIHIEKGRGQIHFEMLCRLAYALEIDISRLCKAG